MAQIEQINSTILGAAAEHYVMCQLLRQGKIAALAPAGVPDADIIVSDRVGSALAAVQVKARRAIGADGGWHMRKKHTDEKMVRDLLFYVFVDFGTGLADVPKCWIMPSAKVAEVLSKSYNNWHATPGKKGQQRADHDMRRLLPDYSREKLEGYGLGWMDTYRDAWRLITPSAQQ